MQRVIETYLKKRYCAAPWPLAGDTGGSLACVVVIPALAEYDWLFDTLRALCHAGEQALAVTQVIVVVNNRPPGYVTSQDMADNQQTLAMLRLHAADSSFAPLRLAWVDAASPDKALPPKEGVGLARKIGADHALRLLAAAGRPDAPIVHLDADAPPAPGYLDAVIAFYEERPRWGGYASYRHTIGDAHTAAGQTMIAYETYMRYHELSLRWAGSPYAYPALGSIMSCSAQAYAAAGGMNRRCAAEDFYFMQQLVKTGCLEQIPKALVFPAGRISRRTPFGTGQTVGNTVDAGHAHAVLFNPGTYEALRRWLDWQANNIRCSGKQALAGAAAIHPALHHFLAAHDFSGKWEAIAANHPGEDARRRQCNIWFDGLRTIQLIHHFRDKVWPDISAERALGILADRIDDAALSANANLPEPALRCLRDLCERPHNP